MKRAIYADYAIASDFMDGVYALYMAMVEGMGANPNDPEARLEGIQYAMQTFTDCADSFAEKFNFEWRWVIDEEEAS